MTMPTSQCVRSFIALTGSLVVALAVVSYSTYASGPDSRKAPKFYDDDPLMRVVDTQDAAKVQPRQISLMLDAAINLFGRPGLQDVGRAENVNTIDEVPDSNWFTNRAGTRPFTPDEMYRGPSDDAGPAPGQWTVSRKSNGVSPGFTIRLGFPNSAPAQKRW